MPMDTFLINSATAAAGFERPYGEAELALISHVSLIDMIDPAHDGYRLFARNTDKVLNLRGVRSGGLWTPRSTANFSLERLGIGPDGVPVLTMNSSSACRFSGPASGANIPASSFTLFGCWLPTGAGNHWGMASRDAVNPVVIGYSTDYKPRFYTKAATPELAVAGTAMTVQANRLSLFVAEWNAGTTTATLTVDGVQAFSTTLAAPVHTDRRMSAGAATYPTDPAGMLQGQFAFGGVMNGLDPTFEPLIRAFAKERFPTGMAHAA